MNAYELAEKLYLSSMDTYHEEAATMLRKQADRIAELEKDLYMIQRHYDQLETFSPSGNNAQDVGKTTNNLPKCE